MKVLVTGAGGFVGRWLTKELAESGHEPIAMARQNLDVTDPGRLHDVLEAERPEAIAHLAAVSFAHDADADPQRAFETAIGGTLALMEAVRRVDRSITVLVTGSSEVYGRPEPRDLPLGESAPLRPRGVYALSKVGQESVALSQGLRNGIRTIVTRSFNHSGSGQRQTFVVPALARRVLAVRNGDAETVPVGNLDVRRDFTHVGDVVRAYRLLLESGAADGQPTVTVLNVCSGRSVSIRELLELVCQEAGIAPAIRVAPGLVRRHEAPEIVGDHRALTMATGWEPELALDAVVADVWQDALTRGNANVGQYSAPL